MKLKPQTLAGNHQYFITWLVNIKCLMSLSLQNSQRAPKLNTRNCSFQSILCTFLRSNVCEKNSPVSAKYWKKMHAKENWFLLSASRCIHDKSREFTEFWRQRWISAGVSAPFSFFQRDQCCQFSYFVARSSYFWTFRSYKNFLLTPSYKSSYFWKGL